MSAPGIDRDKQGEESETLYSALALLRMLVNLTMFSTRSSQYVTYCQSELRYPHEIMHQLLQA
jgi:hypothetical protein